MTGDRTLLSVREARWFARSTFTHHLGLFTSVLLTLVGTWVALEIVVIAGQRFGLVWWAVAHLAFLVVYLGIVAGFLHMCLVFYDGGAPTYGDTFTHMTLGPRLLVGHIVYLVIVVGGLALLVVPGIYLAMRFALFGYCLVEGETNVLRSFHRSALLTRNTQFPLLAIFVGVVFLNLLGASVFGLGVFVTIPFSVLLTAAIYRQLRGDA
jgi:hypothetical protein